MRNQNVQFDGLIAPPETHAKKYPPSSMKNIRLCNAFAPQRGGTTFYAAEGTAAHGIAALCLENGCEAYDYVGMTYEVDDHVITLDAEMMRQVQVGYVEPVLARAAGDTILVEQKLPLKPVTGEDSFGTADVVILHDKSISIVDLKFGQGLRIDAKDNDQLLTYALAAYKEFGHRVKDIEHVDLVIIQPRLNHTSEWRVSIEELEAYGVRLAIMIDAIEHGNIKINPGAEQCRWCAKAPTCSVLAVTTLQAVGADFDNLDQAPDARDADNAELAKKLAAVETVKAWIKAVEEESRKRLLNGQSLPGFKLVEGRRGSRKWVDEHDVEEMMRAMRLKQDLMYEKSLVSPTSLEKLVKRGAIGPRQWNKLKGLVVQAEGSPTIVEESDPRTPLVIDPTGGLFPDNT